jgi:hypothetical protein
MSRNARYMRFTEIDRWRATPYDMPPDPQRDTVMRRVRQIAEWLRHAIDEGSGRSLDLIIDSWVGSWIATIETAYADHCGVISVHRNQAAEWLAETSRIAEHENQELERIRQAHQACRARLAGESHPDGADVPKPRGWAAPHLLGGRGKAELIAAGALILAGALTDTVAFKSTLDLLLRQREWLSWVMATGATSMALVAAASLGVSLSIRHHDEAPGSRAAVRATALIWVGLGLAMFLVRWQVTTASPAFCFGGCTAAGTGHPALVALFFAAIYAISGTCTIVEAERLYNPVYFALGRLGRMLRRQATVAARVAGEMERARSAVDHHSGEFEREDYRRAAAIAERKALGAEAANYARILMASFMQDPAKTHVTEMGPSPDMPPAGMHSADRRATTEPDGRHGLAFAGRAIPPKSLIDMSPTRRGQDDA